MLNKVTFSNTKLPEAGAVLALSRHAPWASQRRLGSIRKALKNTDLVFSAWQGGRLVGMARCTTDFTFRAVLWDVIVDPALHRRGLGTQLVRSALRHPRLKSVDQFWLYTTDKQDFYRRFGFKLFPGNMMVLKKPAPGR